LVLRKLSTTQLAPAASAIVQHTVLTAFVKGGKAAQEDRVCVHAFDSNAKSTRAEHDALLLQKENLMMPVLARQLKIVTGSNDNVVMHTRYR
jgi:hypothetical protein